MNKLKFNRVSHPKGGNKLGPKNSSVQYFTGTEEEKIDTLVRETIQNPLDNPLNENKPVEIIFQEVFIPTKDIPFADEIRKTLNALLVELSKLKKTSGGQIDEYIDYYSKAKERLDKNNLLCLKISDYNTIGLIGSRNDQGTNLGRFLGGTGFFDDSSTGGGSGGLGKFAPFGSSSLNFCFYSSLNTKGEYVYYGWGNNFYHEINGKEYQGEINIGDHDDVLKLSKPFPYGFLSERTQEGTDVFILGHNTDFQDDWTKLMSTAVLRNFFGSIIDEKLTVKIINAKEEESLINANTISDYLHLFDRTKRTHNSKGIPADKYVYECIEAYRNGKVYNSLNTEVKTPTLGECEVRVILNEDFSKHFAYIRGPRMLITIKKMSAGDLPYSGVFCCMSEKGNKILRNVEDSHHKEWRFENKGIQRKARKEKRDFIKYCISQEASHESEDSFGLTGTSLFSIGGSKKSKSGTESTDITEEETSIIYPKNSFSSNAKTNLKFGGVVVVDKHGKRKKIKPKKPKYKKPDKPKPQKPDPDRKPQRKYTVSDFKAQIFKNDAEVNEYHLFIESHVNTDVRNIKFSIPGAEGISFIDEIFDKNGVIVHRDKAFKESENVFENFEISKGLNRFVVKTKINNKVEILIK